MSTEYRTWVPEIMYEEDASGQSSLLPFILVPPDQEMPVFLLIWEHKDTGETEPGPDGEEISIVQPELRQYARMDVLKERLDPVDYDKVRAALGLEPLLEATQKGQEITDKAMSASDLQNHPEED